MFGKDKPPVPAVEVMLNTPHGAELVRKGDIMAIKESIRASSERGVQSFDVALYKLVQDGRVGLEEALSCADSRANLEAKINFG